MAIRSSPQYLVAVSAPSPNIALLPWGQRGLNSRVSFLSSLSIRKQRHGHGSSLLVNKEVVSRRSCGVRACLAVPPSSPVNSAISRTKLYVSGLSFRTTKESLTNAFQKFGQITEVNLVMDKIAKRPRGFAFLRYAREEESQKAIEGMHGKFLDGRVIFVEAAKPR